MGTLETFQPNLGGTAERQVSFVPDVDEGIFVLMRTFGRFQYRPSDRLQY